MKKFLDFGSLAGILIAVILIGIFYLPHRPAQANSTGTFKDFPVGQARMINLAARSEALEDLTAREQLDQMRDWLLITAISASGLSAEEINKALFDLPPIRHGYMQQVANFEYGDTRSCYIGNGQVLALVPADTSDERKEKLARIADEQRKNLGEKPVTLLIFDYELKPADDPTQQTAMLTRRDSINVTDLFTSSAGYFEAKINSLSDLKGFMEQVDDLTYVSMKDGLTVGGRKIKGHDYRGIRVEEVATLYQSEAKIHGNINTLQRKIDEFNARWAKRTYVTEAEKKELEREHAQEEAALEEELRQARSQGKLVSSSGFSLDPTFDYVGLAQKFDTIIAPGIRRVLSGGWLSNSPDNSQDSFRTPGLRGPPTAGGSVEQKIKRARDGVAQRDPDPLYELLGEIATKGERGEALARLIEQTIKESYGYQAARYDGELLGTEAGMVLFYTDLLAKLWAINYQNSAPSGDVPGFSPMTALPVSSVYKQELEELSNTRLWFGPQDKGFQVADQGESMLFARTATRVYAASSNSLTPGVEAQANAESAAFLGWWDDHYDEIARFEPEYERLNEIMKWSLVVAWLNQKEQATKLGFLQNVPVEHGNWFPEWVKQRPQLRYQTWDQMFYERGYKGTKTEALPRLKSDIYRRFGVEHWLIGGVSLASEEKLAGRVALSAESEVAQAARRSNLNYAPGESTASALKTLEGTTYQFSNASAKEAITTATAREGAKLRGLYGEIANQPVERVVTHGNDGFNIGARVADVPLGELRVGNAGNGFSVGWESRDMDVGASLARQLSMSHEPSKVLALNPDVEAAIKLPGNDGYFVKLEASERWLKVTPEGTPSTSLQSGYAARVGDFDARAQNYNLAWVKPGDVTTSLPRGSTIRLRKVTSTDNRYEMEMGSPINAGESISIEQGGTSVRGMLDPATNEVSFAYDELPQTLRDDPSLLRRLVAEARPSAVRGSRYVVGEFNKSSLIAQLRRGDYRAVARELVQAPEAFKEQLDAQLSAGLAECKGMMLNEQYQMASVRLDDLIQIYGPRDELLAHKLVTDLNLPGSTRNSLTQLVTQGNRPTMMDEISQRLNDYIMVGRRRGTIKFVREGNDVVVRYEVPDLSEGSLLATGEPNQVKAFIYVQDTPGFNNLDWQLSPQRTLEAAISGQFKAQVIKLPRSDVARFKPALIYDQAEGVTFKAINISGAGRGFLQPRYFIGNGNPSHYLGGGGGFGPRGPRYIPILPCLEDDDKDSNKDDDDGDCDNEDRDTTIVIVRQ